MHKKEAKTCLHKEFFFLTKVSDEFAICSTAGFTLNKWYRNIKEHSVGSKGRYGVIREGTSAVRHNAYSV